MQVISMIQPNELNKTRYTIRDVVHATVDKYMREQSQISIQIDHYAHPIIHAAVGAAAHAAVQHLAPRSPGGMIKKLAHAAVASAMAAWIASSSANGGNTGNQNQQNQQQSQSEQIPQRTPAERQQHGGSIFDQIAANAMAKHAAKQQAAANAPPSPNVQAAQESAANSGAKAGVQLERPSRPLKDPGDKSSAGSGSGSGSGATGPGAGGFKGDDHPRESAFHDGKKPGQFAPKGEGSTGSADSGNPPSSPAEKGEGPESSSPSPSPRNYPDNLDKPASEQTNYAPEQRSIEGSYPDSQQPPQPQPFIKPDIGKTAPAPNPRKAMAEGRSPVPLHPLVFPTKEELKAQKKAEKQAAKQQAERVDFNPNKLEEESSGMADDKEFTVPKPKESDFQTKESLARMKRWRARRPENEAEKEKWKKEKPSFENAMKEWNRRHGAHKASITKKTKSTVIPDVALEHDLDHDLLEHAVNEELKMVLPAHQRQEEARKYVSSMGWTANRINRAEDSGRDNTNTNMDEEASVWANLYPEIAGDDEHEWVAKMWNLSKQGVQDPPSATDEDFVRSVAKKLVDQGYAEGSSGANSSSFSADEGSGFDDESDLQPVHGSPGDLDYTPFSRVYVDMIVDKYLRKHGVS